MATDYTAYSTATPVPTAGQSRALKALGGAIAITTAMLALNKTTGLFKVPAGFNLVQLIGTVTDMDTGGSPALVIKIGDASDDDRFLTTSTSGQAGGALAALATTGVGYHFDADTEIVMTCSTAAATAAAGTLTLFLIGYLD